MSEEKVLTRDIAEEFEINTQEQLEKFKNGDPTAKVNLSKWLKAKQQKAQKGDLDAQVSVGDRKRALGWSCRGFSSTAFSHWLGLKPAVGTECSRLLG